MVMVMEGLHEPFREFARAMIIDIDQGGDAVAGIGHIDGGLAQPRTRQVADGFGPVLVALHLDDAVEFAHEIVVQGNGYALHVAASPVNWFPAVIAGQMRLRQSASVDAREGSGSSILSRRAGQWR